MLVAHLRLLSHVQMRHGRYGPGYPAGQLANPRRLTGHGTAAGHTLDTAQRGHRCDVGGTVAGPRALRGSCAAAEGLPEDAETRAQQRV